MNPVLSKLTMCVCAAGTGAAILPAAHVVKRHFSPRPAVHRVVQSPLLDAAAARPDCLPGVTLAGGGLGEGGGGGMSELSPLLGNAPGTTSRGGFPFGGFSPDDTSGGGGGGIPGGTGGGGGLPGGGGGITPPGGGVITPPGGGVTPPGPPSSSNAPEPAAWILMVAGFGLAGGAIRYRRVSPA